MVAAETAPDRLARMLALVAYLRDRPGVAVAQVAEHFGTSQAQVLDDVHTLWVSGTPGYMHGDLIDFSSDDLERGVLTLTDSREMDRPLRLSSGEAVALLVALQTLAAALGGRDEVLESTIGALREAAGEAARAADHLDLYLGAGAVEEHAATVRRALSQERRLHLRYVSASDATTERDVDPLQLLTDSRHWFLVGWCHRAHAVRQFRLDRILALEVLDIAADPHPEAGPRDRSEPELASAPWQVRVELSSRARWVAEQLPVSRVRELDEGWFAVELAVVDLAWLHNLLLGLGDRVRAVAPAEVADGVRSRARAALAAYVELGLLDDDGPVGHVDSTAETSR